METKLRGATAGPDAARGAITPVRGIRLQIGVTGTGQVRGSRAISEA